MVNFSPICDSGVPHIRQVCCGLRFLFGEKFPQSPLIFYTPVLLLIAICSHTPSMLRNGSFLVPCKITFYTIFPHILVTICEAFFSFPFSAFRFPFAHIRQVCCGLRFLFVSKSELLTLLRRKFFWGLLGITGGAPLVLTVAR